MGVGCNVPEGYLTPTPVPILKKTKKALAVLERRANWLEARAAVRAFNRQPASFDDVEISALRWAVATIRTAIDAGRVDQTTVPDMESIAIQSRVDATERG